MSSHAVGRRGLEDLELWLAGLFTAAELAAAELLLQMSVKAKVDNFLHGALYHVTSLQDDGHGTLREACRAKEPLWIVFEVSGTIHLETYLRVSSHKTIDGRGQWVRLTGKGLQLKDCRHVIVCNLEFEAGRGHDVDGIHRWTPTNATVDF